MEDVTHESKEPAAASLSGEPVAEEEEEMERAPDSDPKRPDPPIETKLLDEKTAREDALHAEQTLRMTVRLVAITGAVLAVFAALAFDLRSGIAALIGGALATVNLLLFGRLVAAYVAQKGNAAPWAVVAALKIVGLFAVLFVLISRADVPGLGIALGYASLPIGITFSSLFKGKEPSTSV